MMEGKYFSVYCDESCHLERDDIPVMVLGGIWCETTAVREISEIIRRIKIIHGLARDFEIKWSKVSPAKVSFYKDILSLYFDDIRLRFRGLIVSDKTNLNHEVFNQTHDEWYYKMYYLLLKFIISSPNHYRIYLDIKDTRGGPKTTKLHRILASKFHDFNTEFIERVQQVRSHESELLQVADLISGLLSYSNRGLNSSPAKNNLVAFAQEKLGRNALSLTSSFGNTKFNILFWCPQEEWE